jgi:2-keto-3-deoxy-L-rhamnonate aldolase RhmA
MGVTSKQIVVSGNNYWNIRPNQERKEILMTLFENVTKRKLRSGELALGFGVHHLRTAATAMIAAATGHDWLFIDLEHGAFSVHEASQICLAALSTGVTPIVRIAADALDEGTRALDNGAFGVIVPHVDTVTQAKRVANVFRYPPIGSRSWGGPPALYAFSPPGNAEAQAAINQELLVVAMIESEQGVANAGEIAAVEGIDALLIGTSDLSAEMGISGQIFHPRIQQAYETVGAACRASGKALGMGGVYDQEAATRYIKGGARLVLTGSDHVYLLAGAKLRSEFLRKIA